MNNAEARATIAKNPNGIETLALRNQMTAAREHLQGGPVPDFLKGSNLSPNAKAPTPPTTPETADPNLAAAFAPMQPQEVREAVLEAKVQGLAPAQAEQYGQIASALGLPAGNAKMLAGQIAKHMKDNGLRALTKQEHVENAATLIELLGGRDRAKAVVGRANAYVRSLPAPTQKFVNERIARTSLSYSAPFLLALSGLYTARGGKK